MTKNFLILKTNKLSYIFLFAFVLLALACSTKKDKFVNRKFQALNTKYNVLYNGNIALDKGIEELKLKYKDNYWEILPIERMQVSKENILPGQTKNANFDRAEEKATKAIQKRSMNIEGKEKNPQMDEAHLLLGKARYYDQRFVPALEAFNYILYKYPESDKIYEAKIWRERTNMRMDNDALAVKNLRDLLKQIKFKDQVFADANATLAQAFLNLEQVDSAMYRLKVAEKFTKSDEEKARYRFILGQIFDKLGEKDSANVRYQSVIDMHRRAPRRYVIEAHARQGQYFDAEKGDTIAFLKKYKDLLEDRENRPYLDVLNHQMALFYDKRNKPEQAIKFYNKSLKSKSEDPYLMSSNYRNLAQLYFNKARYQTAGLYYDSTLVRMDIRTREYKNIKKKRENLADVIKFEGIAQKNDSILNVVSLSASDRKSFYEDYIVRLKKAEADKAAAEKARQEKAERLAAANADTADNNDPLDNRSNPKGNTDDTKVKVADSNKNTGASSQAFGPRPTAKEVDGFYFYNPSTVAYGKLEFKKKWGSRALRDNWRLSAAAKDVLEDRVSEENTDEQTAGTETKIGEKPVDEKYTPEFYLKQLPTAPKVLDSLAKERNFAYYQLGVIYKEKFKEYKLAASKLEQLLNNKPEERLVLPTMYNLYKIYDIIDKDKALAMKARIISQYPQSRYAQILSNPNAAQDNSNLTPDAAYQNLFKQYEAGDYIQLLANLDASIEQFAGEEIIPKMELLKANTAGKIKGLEEYKAGLNYVALNYPNAEEGKRAEMILTKDVPKLEKLKFYQQKPESWKIIYKVSNQETPAIKTLVETIKKFTSERTSEKLKYSVDLYTMTENFVVIHGISSDENAKGIATILKDYKDYLVKDQAIVISNENYKIVQIRKNLADYLNTPATEPVPEAPEPTPIPTMPAPPKPGEKNRPQRENRETRPATPPDMSADPGRAPGLQQPGNKQNVQNSDDPMPGTIQQDQPKKATPPKRP